jgi:16S rRNA (guanine966-N2)-methyltransferase
VRIRIIAGELGGRYIEAPPGRRTRPTAERVREAWFSALGDRLEGATVVDLFAGSGALGLEALSRGAARVHFVETDRRAAESIRRNVQDLGVRDRSRLVRRDVFA